MTPDNSHFWIEEFYLTLASRDDILEGKRLDDPAQSGLRDSLVLEATNRWYSEPQKLVQIILTDNWSHWVCISNTISENDIVEIFDTAPPKQLDITSHIQRQIAGIMKSTGNSIEVPLHIRAYCILNIYISHIICNYTYEHTCICDVRSENVSQRSVYTLWEMQNKLWAKKFGDFFFSTIRFKTFR